MNASIVAADGHGCVALLLNQPGGHCLGQIGPLRGVECRLQAPLCQVERFDRNENSACGIWWLGELCHER